MARRPTESNQPLRALIDEAGFSHKGLARRVNDLAEARGLTGLRYDHSSVIRWLSGQQPRDPVPSLLGEIFGMRLGRAIGAGDLGMRASSVPTDLGQEFAHGWQEGITIVTALWKADVERRRFLLDSTFAIGAGATSTVRWLTLPAEGRPAARGRHRVDAADVAEIREVTRTFGRLDNRFGGGRVRPALTRYLDTEVAPLLKDGSYGEETGRQLLSAVAELTKLGGWMAYDLEQHGLAQRYLIQALRLTRAAGDHALGGEVLAGMSHQALYVGQPRHALDLARAAQLSAMRSGVATLLAESHVMEAQAHAALSDGKAAATSLRAAEAAFERADPESEPEWIRYFDRAYLSAKFAHCFRELGDSPNTVRSALGSLDMDSGYVRGRMFNLALLASGYAQQGELEEACRVGAKALDLAASLQSARSRAYIADLRRRLTPYADEPMVAALTERSRELAKAV
ncbi:hypothetical protein [Bailinhaonella thermotolerans]|uniref:Transcriptional regulator n=1 Tax=Bailinhaonella thermotolerans TaxID=1070861 RepID=A0A3A4AD41_9ACTN|nr:hypothetical protein [Bailinhaonella thermotolerans]RJL26585.1 hypothetical protein D5H75_26785 [Bailinhaonella thermotolerans]